MDISKIDVLDLAISKNYRATENGDIIGPRGKILKEAVGTNGYKFFRIRNGNSLSNISSHRFVAHFFGLNIEKYDCIRHINGIKTDNRIENLTVGSFSENFSDIDQKWRTDFARAGAKLKQVLSVEQVQEIKSMLANSDSMGSIARKYGVAKTTIVQIRDGKSYKWIEK